MTNLNKPFSEALTHLKEHKDVWFLFITVPAKTLKIVPTMAMLVQDVDKVGGCLGPKQAQLILAQLGLLDKD